MGKDDYASSGGVLKLKGVKDSKISKKKRKRKNAETDDLKPKERSEAFTEGTTAAGNIPGDSALDTASTEQEVDNHEVHAGKTETERRHEETKRKRLYERLKKEGVKTHKERVEELNKYLSNLSEHHDMPRIGPG